MTDRILTTPLTNDIVSELKIGDTVFISGEIYTARDAAHARICEALQKGEEPPFPIDGAVIYYVGPTPPPPGEVIGSAGPTTSGRMDKYTPMLLRAGLKAMIGKGKRSLKVVKSIEENKAVYFGATGGAGALLSRCIKKVEIVAYEDLGTEAVRKLTVEKMPLVVINDVTGKDLYEAAISKA